MRNLITSNHLLRMMFIHEVSPTLIPPPLGEGLNPKPPRPNSLSQWGRAGVGERSLSQNQQKNKNRDYSNKSCGLSKLNFFAIPLLVSLLLVGCGGRGSPTIKATPQTIHFSATPAMPLHGSATVVATASSGLPVNYSTATTKICSVNSSTGVVTSIAVGTCIIAADQSGNETFAPAPQATQSIAAAFDTNQIITFGVAPALTLYGTATVSANASSNLPVSFSSTTPAVCGVNASTGRVTDLTTGSCIVAADQAGDANYNAAPQVTQTLTVLAWSGPITAPGAPSNVSATLGNTAGTVVVSFDGPSSSGGSPVTGYTVNSVPSAYTTSPITVPCPIPCNGYTFTVAASNTIGTGTASPAADVLTNYDVVTTFFEPDTQPNDTIFRGTFTFNSTTQSVSNLQGGLSESMTGPPMTIVPLTYQLSSVNDGLGGLLVSAFSLNTTNVFQEGGFAANSTGIYFGRGDPGVLAPDAGGQGNSFITINVPLPIPDKPLTAAQIQTLAYGDCAAGGMMGEVCMTGYVGIGTMGGYPVAQTITRK